MRHGETTCNAGGIIQGPRIDAELSERGQQQAIALGKAFRETALDALYVSPMQRARDTAHALAGERLPLQVVPELYELDFGEFCGRPLVDVQDEIQSILQAWQNGFVDTPFPGGESAVLAQARSAPFVRRILEAAKEQNIAVVAHGRLNRVILSSALNQPLSRMQMFPQDNANITHLSVAAEARMLRLNDTAHLAS